VIVTRGAGTIGPDPRKLDPQVIVIAEEYQPFPLPLYPHGIHTAVYPLAVDMENPANRVRALGRPHVTLAKRFALVSGCLDAILTTRRGDAIGATEGMLLMVRDGAVLVARGEPEDATAIAVAALAGEHGLVVAEHAVTVDVLHAAEEVLLAGTACGVIGIVRIDGRDVGAGTEGPVTRRLRERFHALTRGG
jgi:branched-chain amino acid aminotransferase